MERKFPTRFGPYVLAMPLGDGGMADVCLAISAASGRDDVCAIKRIWRGEGPRGDVDERFKREGEVARRLDHPAIARILAVGEAAGELFIAEEFVHGVDLVNVATRDIPIPVAILIVRGFAQALAYLHEVDGLGLVHRNVAPANIRLSFAGQCKLLTLASSHRRGTRALRPERPWGACLTPLPR